MRKIRIQSGKYFQVNIDDSFTGESIIIDNHHMSDSVLTEKEYLALDSVKNIIDSDKPLYLISEG